eukprot:6212981-Pleurochrysis_carterae.AAC.6
MQSSPAMPPTWPLLFLLAVHGVCALVRPTALKTETLAGHLPRRHALLSRTAARPFSAAASAQVGRASVAMSSDAEPLNVDVAVIGGGPAGYTMAALLAEKHGHSVVLVDPDPEAAWPNNYGSWLEEWEVWIPRKQSGADLQAHLRGRLFSAGISGNLGKPR